MRLAGDSGATGELAGLNGLEQLNAAQRRAVEHGLSEGAAGAPPLLIIAGAGSGKTHTLAHRVAHLASMGADPRRILLLTFTRRAATEMTRRAERIAAGLAKSGGSLERRRAKPINWAGTFHAVANRLLRLHAESVALDPSFTVLDRSDAEDLLDLLRDELGLSTRSSRFPRKGTCLAIYSHTVNAQQPLEDTLAKAFPWCESWGDELKRLFGAYVDAKQQQHTLDYDDLLLYWNYLMSEPELAALVAERFDHVLVDEYQDTNALQAAILLRLCPTGNGLTVVGDDAQSIYSFRAATVRNILDFPSHFDPPASVVTLEQNYRSTQPILEACNGVIDEASERFAKQLFSERPSEQRPVLASTDDEPGQVDYVVERILEHREAGVPLRQQAVLMRTSHHSDALEVELSRRNIPFTKYGGLKFLESSHVKDVLCVLRWVENPRDAVAGFRVLQLLPGLGPVSARKILAQLGQGRFQLDSLARCKPPAAAAREWLPLCALLQTLRSSDTDWSGQLGMVRKWYGPHLERIYDAAAVRDVDLEQLEQIAGSHTSREHFLSELALDPPDAAGDEAGPPVLDEDYLILSTIHSAKGQEWDVVYVLNVVDGCIPSDMSTGSPEQIEEERRLLYVAMTRARDHLYLVRPYRFYKRQQHRHGNAHVVVPRSRFLPDELLARFERRARPGLRTGDDEPSRRSATRVDAAAALREMWR